MEDVEILRSLGTPSDVLERYVRLRDKMHRAYLQVLVAIFLMMTEGYISYTTAPILKVDKGILFIGAIFITLYFILVYIVYLRSFKKYLETMKKGWLIEFASEELQRLSLQVVLYVFYFIWITLGFIVSYLYKDVFLMLFFLCLTIVSVPLLIIAFKKTKERGYRILHLFPGDVDEIAEKIEKALGGKKVMVIKYKNSRKYKIDFKSQSNLKLYVFRRPERKGFTTVGIMGVKNENLSEVVKLISRINKILT